MNLARKAVRELRFPAAFRLFLTVLVLAPTAMAAGPDWELRVCADPTRLPYSDRMEQGFDNRIARLLADELGAELVYDWVNFDDLANVRDNHLWTGDCDVVMGLEDGEPGFLHTVAYYRSPYAFVYRPDSGLDIRSFDDLESGNLRLGVQESMSPPYHALIMRGLTDQLHMSGELGMYGSPDRFSQLAAGLRDGRIDVGIAWGPDAAWQAGDDLTVVPVANEVEPPFILMVRSVVMGVRPHDTALRDRIDVALANIWDDVTAVLDGYGVPRSPLPQPRTFEPAEELRYGLILPLPGSDMRTLHPTDNAASAARMGAALAEADAQAGAPVRIMLASAPDADAAQRAAARMAATEQLDALIGGIGDGQAAAIAAVAAETGLQFLNLGADAVRGAVQIGATEEAYLQAIAAAFPGSFALVSPEDSPRLKLAEAILGDRVAAVAPVTDRQLVYTRTFDAVQSADTVVLLMDSAEQEAFLTQYALAGHTAPVTVLPDLAAQSRAHYASLLAGTGGNLAPRVAMWDASLDLPLNERFQGRFGQPMDPAAWSAYAAVMLLADPDAELSKEAVLEDGQLRQTLYLVQIDPEAATSLLASARRDLARVLQEIPAP